MGCDKLEKIIIPAGQKRYFTEMLKDNRYDYLIPLLVER